MKTYTKEELATILDNHKVWLVDSKKGKKANLSGADLSYANLSYANLSYANLSGADLSYANLSGANLSGADLSYANLSSADLSGANLRYANLSYANLSNADLDFSCLPLSCKSLNIGKVDTKLVYQVAMHLAALCNSCEDEGVINLQNYLLKYRKESHINCWIKHVKNRKRSAAKQGVETTNNDETSNG
jgi:uncharacterized protein YjbI with pentapeptide repeats